MNTRSGFSCPKGATPPMACEPVERRRQSAAADRDLQPECSGRRPTSVGGDELVGLVSHCGGDDERIGQAKRAVHRTESRRHDCSIRVERDDRNREPLEEVANHLDRSVTTTRWAHQTFSKRRRRHRQPISLAQRLRQHRSCSDMMHVVAVEKADDDASVEVDQSHSERNSSSSLIA